MPTHTAPGKARAPMHAALTITMAAVWLLVDYPWGLGAFALLAVTPSLRG